MAIEFRRAVLEDAEVIARYAADMAIETENLQLDRERVRRGVEAALREPAKGFYLLAVSESTVVGQLMVTFEWSDWSNAMRWWLQSVYVHPEFRSQGVFSGLFAKVCVLAADDGTVCAVRLYVEQNNQRAQAVYRKLGFEETHYRLYEIGLPRLR